MPYEKETEKGYDFEKESTCHQIKENIYTTNTNSKFVYVTSE